MCLFAMSVYIKLNKFICHPETQRTTAHLRSNNQLHRHRPNDYRMFFIRFHRTIMHIFIFTLVFIESIVIKTQQRSPQQSDYLPINGSNLIGIYSHRAQCPQSVTFTMFSIGKWELEFVQPFHTADAQQCPIPGTSCVIHSLHYSITLFYVNIRFTVPSLFDGASKVDRWPHGAEKNNKIRTAHAPYYASTVSYAHCS